MRQMTRFPRLSIAAAIVAVALVAIAAWQLSSGDGHARNGTASGDEVRIAARALVDGSTEVALQRRDDHGWGEYIAPEARFLPTEAEVGRWFHSNAIALAPISLSDPGPGPLKIALLQTVHGAAADRRRAFKLAIAHLNQAGGVFGRPVIGVIADFNLDEQFIVASATRLVEEEGVHAFVGPTFSSTSLIISEHISNPRQIPTVSPSATSPALTEADPGDFFFRTSPSDGAGQGAVLAELAREQGHERIAILYRDDAWGKGLADEVLRSQTGEAIALPLDHINGVTFLPEIRNAAEVGATVLIVLGCWKEAATVIGESVASGTFDHFLLGDCGQSRSLFEALGADIATTLIGTAPTVGEATESTTFFVDGYTAMWGQPPPVNVSYVPSVYDATISLALAAQSTDGPAIRDQLRGISDGQGKSLTAAQLAAALEALERGQQIDFDGAVSSLDWDDHGDITRFTIGIWQFTADGEVEILRRLPIDLNR
ncbi:MAG: ABC transporter substrate-binding protein [Chloroflexota bacterium]|nr:ABC transporter substrate-binding protein [Chloroflexota bacterium]MDE2896209.1 ABC transporter substrate-binding protein [Chloroflexota bacterium]